MYLNVFYITLLFMYTEEIAINIVLCTNVINLEVLYAK